MKYTIVEEHHHQKKNNHEQKIVQQNILSVLQQLNQKAKEELEPEEIQDIVSIMKSKQKSAYQLTLFQEGQYFQTQNKQLSQESKESASKWIQLLSDRFNLEIQTNKNVKIKDLSKNMKQLKKQLRQKLQKVNKQMHQLPQTLKKKADEQVKVLMQFKQQSYWIKNAQKTEKIKQFIKQNRQKQGLLRKRYKSQMRRREEISKRQEQQEIKQKQEQKKKLFQHGLQKSKQAHEQRYEYYKQNSDRIEKIQQFLSKHKPAKPLFKKYQQKYQNQVIKPLIEYRKRRLQIIKKNHQPLDQDEIDQHLQKYEQYKAQLVAQYQSKKQQFQSQKQQIQQQLKDMFHGRYYQEISQQGNSFVMDKKYRKQNRSKRLQYSTSVLQKFKPKIDFKKRKSLQQSIKNLTLLEDKTKKKIYKNGSLIFQDKQDPNTRKIGLEYLAALRKYLEGKPKKERNASSSLMELSDSKYKKIDYLRQNKPKIKFKASMSEWRKVMQDKNFSAKDKYTFVKQSITTLEHKAEQRQLQAKNMKKDPKQLQKKQQFDKFYLQSVQAKMVILKDLMLGH